MTEIRLVDTIGIFRLITEPLLARFLETFTDNYLAISLKLPQLARATTSIKLLRHCRRDEQEGQAQLHCRRSC